MFLSSFSVWNPDLEVLVDNQAWWSTPEISGLQMFKQEDHDHSLGYVTRLPLKQSFNLYCYIVIHHSATTVKALASQFCSDLAEVGSVVTSFSLCHTASDFLSVPGTT